MMKDEKYQKSLNVAAKLSRLFVVALVIALFVIACAFSLAMSGWVTPRLTPVSHVATDYYFLAIAGVLLGAVSCLCLRSANSARSSGKPNGKRRFRMLLRTAIIMDLAMIAGIVFVMSDAYRHTAAVISYGADPAICDICYWQGVTFAFGVATGHIFGMLAIQVVNRR